MKACSQDDSWEAAIGRMLTDSRALLLCMTGLDVLVLGVGVSVHVSADGGGAELGCMHVLVICYLVETPRIKSW